MLHKEDSSREKEFYHQSSWPVKRAHNLNGSSLVPFPRLYREKPLIIHGSFWLGKRLPTYASRRTHASQALLRAFW
jgi:hypothetical protein